MLNEALLKLEQDIDQMIEQNKQLTEQVERVTQERDQLSSKLQQLESDNESLLLEGMEQEEKQEQTLNRIKAMLNRFDDSESTNLNHSQATESSEEVSPHQTNGSAANFELAEQQSIS